MADKENDDMLEETTEIKQGHADIGKFNLGIYAVLTIVCVVYLIRHFNP